MEIMPLLADAVQSQRTWLRDFADDEVTISMDLYEVILAYQHYRRPRPRQAVVAVISGQITSPASQRRAGSCS